MATIKPRIFISYARVDGETLAEDLEAQLNQVFGAGSVWRDRTGMEGDDAWWLQIEAAIRNAEYFVLIATPAALKRPMVIKEWRTARRFGTCVYAVLHPDPDPDLQLDFEALPPDSKALPQWQRDAQFFDISTPERWEIVLNHLKGPCTATPRPMMAPALPDSFVPRPDVFDSLKAALLSTDRRNPVAITTALRGAGGFGKTTMAAALCHDDEVQTAFDDRILWVTLGTQPDVLSELRRLIKALTGADAAFATPTEGGQALAEALGERDCLLVIDDAWHGEHVQPFLTTTNTHGKRCARLITTRDGGIAIHAKAHIHAEVDEMRPEQSRALLRAGVAGLTAVGEHDIAAIAERLGHWAQMLEIANYMLRERIDLFAASADGAAEWLWQILQSEGINVLQNDHDEERRRNVHELLDVSLRTLPPEELARAFELSIFRDNLDIPLTALATLWRMSEGTAEMKVRPLARRSLVKYSSTTRTLRLHDNIREYFATRLPDAAAVHQRLLNAWGDVYALPTPFAWRHIAYHFLAVGRAADLRALFFDFRWLAAKLEALDTAALITDCDEWLNRGEDVDVRLLRSALILSVPALVVDKAQLAAQLEGRLFAHRDITIIHRLLDTIIYPAGAFRSIRTDVPTHEQAGGARLATFEGHTDWVNGALALDDGTLVSWSDDRTLIRWSREGSRLTTFEGHRYWVTGALVLDDGTLVSWSYNTLIRWSREGARLATFEGHTRDVNGALALDDGTLVSWSDDDTLIRWSREGSRLTTFEGHTNKVKGALVLDDGTLVSWSLDGTLIRWSREGARLATFEGHTYQVRGALALDDGTLVSWSEDKTLIRWSREGARLATFEGHRYGVTGALAPDDGTLVSWSYNTLIRWSREGSRLAIFEGHTSGVNGALVLDDGTLVSWSLDGTLIRWSREGSRLATFERHGVGVTGVLALDDGTLVSWGLDGTLIRWSREGSRLATFEGHTNKVKGALVLDDGTLVSWSYNTLIRWSREGTRLATFEGHTNKVKGALVLDDGTLVSWSYNTLIRWSREGARLATFEGHPDWVNGALALDDGTLVSWSDDRTLIRWSREGSRLTTFEGHRSWVTGALVLDDGTLVSWSLDRTLIRWSPEGSRLATFEGHTNKVKGALVLDDGTLVSWSYNTLIRWSREGTRLATFEGHTRDVNGALALDDGTLVSWSDDRTLIRWSREGNQLPLTSEHRDAVRDAVLERRTDLLLSDSTVINRSAHWLERQLPDGTILSRFYGDAAFTVVLVLPDDTVVAGDAAGQMLFLRVVAQPGSKTSTE